MPVNPSARLYKGNGRQVAAGDRGVQIGRVLIMVVAQGFVGHEARLVLESVADIAVLVAVRPHGAVVQLVGIARETISPGVLIPLVAVGNKRYVAFEQNVPDAPLQRSRNRKRRVARVAVGGRVASV